MENKNFIIALLALGIGLSGIGLGTYATLVRGPPGPPGQDGVDGTDGTDGLDAPGYYCYSETEIQNAIISIGLGSGIITIMENIVLSATINVNGGGDYIIQGYGLITIESPNSYSAFNITFARSCIIRDLIIDASKTAVDIFAISIAEIEDNFVSIDNIHIFDGEDRPYSSGIEVSSENVIVRNCKIENIFTAIFINSNFAMVYDNFIINTIDGIFLYSCVNAVVKNNFIQNTYLGINCVNSNYTVVSYNVIKEFYSGGISLSSGFLFTTPPPGFYHFTFHNEIVGNQISVAAPSSLEDNRTCILVQDSEENQIIGNYCFKCINEDPSYYGIGITIADGDNNYIATNTFVMNDINLYIDSLSTGNVLLGNVE